MKNTYIRPDSESVIRVEHILYTTSPKEGDNDTGNLPLEAKSTFFHDEEEDLLSPEDGWPTWKGLWEE